MAFVLIGFLSLLWICMEDTDISRFIALLLYNSVVRDLPLCAEQCSQHSGDI